MRPLRLGLEDARRPLGAPWKVLERDYLLSWILAGVGEVPALCDTLVFKGGTAVRKSCLGDYHLSEDSDFSGLPGVPISATLSQMVNNACAAAARLLDPYAPVPVAAARYIWDESHIHASKRPLRFEHAFRGRPIA